MPFTYIGAVNRDKARERETNLTKFLSNRMFRHRNDRMRQASTGKPLKCESMSTRTNLWLGYPVVL